MKSLILTFSFFFFYNIGFSQISEPCAPPCYKVITGTGTNETIQEIISLPNGRILAGGRLNDQVVLMQVTDDLEIKSTQHFDTPNSNDFVRKMLLDADGMYITTTRDINVGETQTGIQKINPATGEIIWSKRIPSPAYFNIDRFLEISPTGNYIAAGILSSVNGCESFILEIDRNSGESVWSNRVNLGNCSFFEDAVLANGSIYGGGFHRYGYVDQIRAGITRMDMQGNVVWSKHYLTNLSAAARTYITGFAATETELFATIRGSLSDDDLTNSVAGFMRLDFEGNPMSGKYFTTIEGNSIAFNEVIRLDDGWALAGNYNNFADDNNRKLFVVKIDNDNNLVWAKAIGSTSFETANSLAATDKTIIIAGTTKEFDATNGDFVIASLTLDGSGSSEDCEYITDIELIETDFGAMIYQADSPVQGFSQTLNFLDFSTNTTEVEELPEETFCSELVDTDYISKEKYAINLYPNPNQGKVFLEGIDNLKGKYIVYDAVGREIQNGQLTNAITIKTLRSGVYFFKVLNQKNEVIFTKKMIVTPPRA